MIRNDMLLTRDSLETCTIAPFPSPVESQQLVLVWNLSGFDEGLLQ